MRDLLTRVLFWLFDKGIASRGIRLPNRVVISAYAGLGSSLEDQRPRSVSRRFSDARYRCQSADGATACWSCRRSGHTGSEFHVDCDADASELCGAVGGSIWLWAIAAERDRKPGCKRYLYQFHWPPHFDIYPRRHNCRQWLVRPQRWRCDRRTIILPGFWRVLGAQRYCPRRGNIYRGDRQCFDHRLAGVPLNAYIQRFHHWPVLAV